MTFPGRLAEQIVPDQIHRLSLSFLIDDLDIRRGGVAANISFGLAVLGLRPALVGAVGPDFAEYRVWLEEHGVDTSSVLVSQTKHTARFLCTTDADQNQIASFYPGAMSEARDIALPQIVARLGGLDLVLIGANDPAAMLRHTRECRENGIAFAADPSQQLAGMEADSIRELVQGATYLFSNDYERALMESKTGWSSDDVLARVGTRITTLGAEGVLIERRDEPAVRVPAVAADVIADPTGVGDAFRAGFLAATAWGLPIERSAQVGALLATYVIESVGPQEYTFTGEGFLARLREAFGAQAADDVAEYLPAGRATTSS